MIIIINWGKLSRDVIWFEMLVSKLDVAKVCYSS